MFSFFFLLFFCFGLLCLVFSFISQQLINHSNLLSREDFEVVSLSKEVVGKPPLLNERNTSSNDIGSDLSEVLKENKLLYKSTAQISK